MNSKNKTIIKFIIFIIAIVAIIYAVQFYGVRDYLSIEKIRTSVEMFGPLAPIGFIIIYNIGSIIFLPGTILSVAGGAIFGAAKGTIYVVIGATLGATLAFLISRYFARSFFEDIVEKKFPKLGEYDEKLEKNGFMTVLFFRLIPIFPFNGLNFALGLTKVKTKDYFLATMIGIIPGTFAFVYLGSSIASMNFRNILFAVLLLALLSFSIKTFNKRNNKKEKDLGSLDMPK